MFATRKIVEIRLATPKPGDRGSSTIAELVRARGPRHARHRRHRREARLRGRTLELGESHRRARRARRDLADRAQRAAALDSAAGCGQRLKLTAAAAQSLAERVEGNLLAADQEIKRLALTAAGREVDEAEVLEFVANNSRFDVFALADAVLAGETGRTFKILSGLRAEGVHPVQISWVLNRDISLLARLEYAVRHGDNLDGALMRTGVWRRRQPLVKQALGEVQGTAVEGAADRGGTRRCGIERRIPGRALDDAHGFVGRAAAPARGCEGTLTACDRSASSAVRSIPSTTATCARRSSSSDAGSRRRALRAVREPPAPCRADDRWRVAAEDGARRDSRRARLRRRRLASSFASGPSYTIDTLASFRAEFAAQALCLMVGMDAFLGLPQWHRWRELTTLAHIVVAHRPGWQAPTSGTLGELLRERRHGVRAELAAQPAGLVHIQPVTQLEISRPTCAIRCAPAATRSS